MLTSKHTSIANIIHLLSDQESDKNDITSCFVSNNYSNGLSMGIEKCAPKYKIKMPNNFYVRIFELYLNESSIIYYS